jgi:hypothetical protein
MYFSKESICAARVIPRTFVDLPLGNERLSRKAPKAIATNFMRILGSASSSANVLPSQILPSHRSATPAHIVRPRTSGSRPRVDTATEIRFPDYRSHRRENSIFHAIRLSSSPSHRRRRLGCGAASRRPAL